MPEKIARRLASYASGDLGVLGPIGWHCFGLSGSNGSILFVAPQPLSCASLEAGIGGDAIELSKSLGDTSGRFKVAEIAAGLFPAADGFVRDVEREELEPPASFPAGPIRTDRIRRVGDDAVLFETPGGIDGLGTHSRLRRNGEPISGAVVLMPDEPIDLPLLAVRLGARDRD